MTHSSAPPTQLEIFDDVLACYAGADALTNSQLYQSVGDRLDIDPDAWTTKTPVGQKGQKHNLLARKARWTQQTLKHLGLLERIGQGVWQLTLKGRKKLTMAQEKTVLIGFSTDLGLALWARSEDVFPQLEERFDLVLTSLPFPLSKPRAYGNPKEDEYVEWALQLLEPISRNLTEEGSLVINLGNDIFVPGKPARSLYREELVLEIHRRLGLHKMDEWVWNVTNRPPGPVQWASLSRQQLGGTYEPIYWFAKDPTKVNADNRRVLQEHSTVHQKLMAAGGEKRPTNYGDGAYRLRRGSFGNVTPGRIPRNVFNIPHNCPDKRQAAALAKSVGLPVHSAVMPLTLAKFIIEFLTEKGGLVVDPCSGWQTVGKAAEETGRRWLCVEQAAEYILGGSLRFLKQPGFTAGGQLHGL